MANPFAHTFAETVAKSGLAKRIPVWAAVDETFEGGALLKPSESLKVGTVVPAATPITISKLGGEPVLNGDEPTGLTLHDAIIGENGAPVDIVTRGKLFVTRAESTITEAQKAALKERILMIEE